MDRERIVAIRNYAKVVVVAHFEESPCAGLFAEYGGEAAISLEAEILLCIADPDARKVCSLGLNGRLHVHRSRAVQGLVKQAVTHHVEDLYTDRSAGTL